MQTTVEDLDIQEEIEVDTDSAPKKRPSRQEKRPPSTKKRRTRLLKKEIQAICTELSLIKPVEILPTIVSRVEADETHLRTFPDRKKLWKDVSISEAMPDFVEQLILGYIDLYKTHQKGKDKYTHFLVAWHELLSQYTVEGNNLEDETWCALVSDSYGNFSAEDRSAIVTSIAKAVYDILTEKASQIQGQSEDKVHDDSVYPQSRESIPDDDASIVRVSGFALHSAIEYRRKALLPKNKTKHSSVASHNFAQELDVLTRLKAEDKSFVPRVIDFQDRGHMTIMHQAMLSFGRGLFTTVRASLNYSSYQEYGSEVFKRTRKHVLDSSELFQTFKACLENVSHTSAQGPVSEMDDALLNKVYNTLVTKMLHTINNDFLKNVSLLGNIATGKGTNAKLLLRDKLKAAAADTISRIPKI